MYFLFDLAIAVYLLLMMIDTSFTFKVTISSLFFAPVFRFLFLSALWYPSCFMQPLSILFLLSSYIMCFLRFMLLF